MFNSSINLAVANKAINELSEAQYLEVVLTTLGLLVFDSESFDKSNYISVFLKNEACNSRKNSTKREATNATYDATKYNVVG